MSSSSRRVFIVVYLWCLILKGYQPAPSARLVVGVQECIHGVLLGLGVVSDEREASTFAFVGTGLVEEEVQLGERAILSKQLPEQTPAMNR